jgi:GrpB-like predicted nucleotidyltransferase (UPF0157 family)
LRGQQNKPVLTRSLRVQILPEDTGGLVEKPAPAEHWDGRAPLTENYLREHTIGELQSISSPIRILDYDPEWPRRFEVIAHEIRSALRNNALRIEHVGSTSVPDLAAKPIIDILLAVADSSKESDYIPCLETYGYVLHIREPEWYEHRMLTGFENQVNLHVFSEGCEEIDRMIRFRNWLRASPADRELYARTKLALAQQEWEYIQNYADAKSEVIEAILSRMQASNA